MGLVGSIVKYYETRTQLLISQDDACVWWQRVGVEIYAILRKVSRNYSFVIKPLEPEEVMGQENLRISGRKCFVYSVKFSKEPSSEDIRILETVISRELCKFADERSLLTLVITI